jgi:hypothetical protein
LTGTFKNNNPFSIILLFFLGLVLKAASFLRPQVPVAHGTDGILYHRLTDMLAGPGHRAPVLYPILAYALVFIQAVAFNHILINRRLLPRANYLPAMSYLLITSLFPEWWQFSAALVVNTLMVWVWDRMCGLYNNPRGKLMLYNIGFVLGVSSFIYFPSAAFTLLLVFALLIMRSFSISEWLVSLLGLTTPYYFLFAWSYLTDHWDLHALIPRVSLSFPAFQQTIWAWGGILLLVAPFLVGGILIQGNILRMLIQVRKGWSLMLVYILVSLLIPFINSSSTFEYWVLCALPFAAFHAYLFFTSERNFLTNMLFWVMVVFILALNLAVLRS